MLDGHSNRDIEEQTRQSEQAFTPPDGPDAVLRGLQQFLAVDVLEFMREPVGQAAIQGQAGGDRRIVAATERVPRKPMASTMRFATSSPSSTCGQLREDAFQRGLAHQFAKALDGIVGHHLAIAKDQHRGADLLDDFQNVGAVQDDFPLPRQRAQQAAQHQRGGHVEAGERLVQDEHVRVVQQRGGEQNLLAHALRIRRQR